MRLRRPPRILRDERDLGVTGGIRGYAVRMSETLAFTGKIVNPEWMPAWAVVEVPGSQDFFGHGKSVKAATTLDGIAVTSALMPTGQGYHFISVSAALRKKLGKDVGDAVEVRIERAPQ